MPGNIVIIEGARETEAYLHHGSEMADHMLRDLVNDAAEYAAHRLELHAPGRIDALVAVDQAPLASVGRMEAVAGVLPDPDELGSDRGLGSDPADWPVFVDVGTGIYGEHHKPIETIPGHVMVWGEGDSKIFARRVKGQPGKHYSDEAFHDTVEWMPSRLARTRLPLE